MLDVAPFPPPPPPHLPLPVTDAYLPVHTVRETTGEMDGSEGDNKWSKRKRPLMAVSTRVVMF